MSYPPFTMTNFTSFILGPRASVLLGGTFLSLTFLTLTGCPSATDTHLENARFALDKCNPSDPGGTQASCQKAVDEAGLVLAGDTTNTEAAILSSSGHLGLAGVDFLQFVSEIIKTQDNPDADISSLKTVIDNVESDNKQEISETELGLAKTVLETATAGLTAATADNVQKRGLFQLGLVQNAQTYIVLVKRVGALTALAGNQELSSTDLENAIDDDLANELKNNFINSDNNLTASGTGSDDETAQAVRQGYCRCIKTDFGYGSPCLRDLSRCQLSETKTENTEQDYDNDGTCGETATLAGTKRKDGSACTTAGDRTDDCKLLLNPPGVEACKESDVN